MRHTLKAVFKRRSEAQHALDELLACGYSRTDTEISAAEGLAAAVRHRLARLMASGLHRHTAAQASAAMSGSHIVTFTADSEPDAERAKRIIQRFHPVGIEDRPSEWDHDPAVMPAACPPGTEPGSLLYRSRDNSPYFGTQSASAPPMGNTFEEPMSDGGRWSGAEARPSRAGRPAPPPDAGPENLEDRVP